MNSVDFIERSIVRQAHNASKLIKVTSRRFSLWDLAGRTLDLAEFSLICTSVMSQK
jgi:hypothetical protein